MKLTNLFDLAPLEFLMHGRKKYTNELLLTQGQGKSAEALDLKQKL